VTSKLNENQQNVGKIAGRFCTVFQMIKAREIPNLQECHTRFWEQYTLKKAHPETFSFWANHIFAKKQALFDVCGLMQY